MEREIAVVLRLLVIAFLLPGCGGDGDRRPDAGRLLDRFRDAKKLLIRVDYQLADEQVAKGLCFDGNTLASHELFLRHKKEKGRFLHLDRSGRLAGTEAGCGRTVSRGEVLMTRGGRVLFLDGRPMGMAEDEWELFWVSGERRPPGATVQPYPRMLFADSFMTDSLADTGWRVEGDCALAKHGGGLPRTLEEERSAVVARAVNPFTMKASGGGRLILDNQAGPPAGPVHFHAEARFYLGVPRTGPLVEQDSLPPDMTLLLAQGAGAAFQAGFGWLGPERGFALCVREEGGPWREVAAWRERRPPIANWARIGLRVTDGYRVEGWLDGVKVAAQDLPRRLSGGIFLESGKAPVEFDDVKVWSLPVPEEEGSEYYVKSRFFAQKGLVDDRHDPAAFRWWVKSEDAFVRRTGVVAGRPCAEIVSSSPLMGDLDYESSPADVEAGALPEGTYRFALWRFAPGAEPGSGRPDFSLQLVRARDGWVLSGAGGDLSSCGNAFTLRLSRRGEDGDRVCVAVPGGRRVPVSGPVPGPVHVGIARLAGAAPQKQDYPHPALHRLRSRQLANEFFEEAPAGWNWIEGAFRMDARWACAKQWNFLAAGSPGVPWMAGKRVFSGDQEHRYFLSLRPALPYDGGDPDFQYDAEADRKAGFPVFKKHHGWYNRRDLDFAFCTNGRDPMSGYAVVFAGDDNRETRLLRKGRVVATNREALIPKDENHEAIHWKWWAFRVRRFGGSVTVDLDGERILSYDDPAPLDGGHIGFFTIRSGLVVSRVVSSAERCAEEPQALYVGGSRAGAWKPLLADSVRLAEGAAPGLTRVSANVGAGFFAVRHTPPAPVDLSATPVLELPLSIGAGSNVNLHLQVGDTSFVLPLSAPVGPCKSLLTPEFEKGEMFQLPDLADADLARRTLAAPAIGGGVLRVDLLRALEGRLAGRPLLRNLSVGNTCNRDYLLAGATGNRSGCFYEVGEPRFVRP